MSGQTCSPSGISEGLQVVRGQDGPRGRFSFLLATLLPMLSTIQDTGFQTRR